jgi:hypothetical protein
MGTVVPVYAAFGVFLMTIHCIVCNSTAVIPKDAAKAMAILVSIISAAIQGATASVAPTQPIEATGPHGRILGQLLAVIRAGLSGATAGDAAGTELSRSIEKYWFSTHDCLCLNCGFYFDQNAL